MMKMMLVVLVLVVAVLFLLVVVVVIITVEVRGSRLYAPVRANRFEEMLPQQNRKVRRHRFDEDGFDGFRSRALVPLLTGCILLVVHGDHLGLALLRLSLL